MKLTKPLFAFTGLLGALFVIVWVTLVAYLLYTAFTMDWSSAAFDLGNIVKSFKEGMQ